MQARIPAMAARRVAMAVIALVALVGAGCSKKIIIQLVPNQPPEVRLTSAPVARDSLRPDFYAYTMQWVGFDPDGRVDHFLIAVDPGRPDSFVTSDTTWHTTARNESTFFFSAGLNYDPINPLDVKAETPHVISIFAVDNEGTLSRRPATRAYFSFTQCPSVQIEQPRPNTTFTPTVTPTVTFQWNGFDPDGQFTVRPVRWVFRLFGRKNIDRPDIQDYIAYALNFPDSVRRRYAPGFVGWNSVGAETTSFQYRNLNPGSLYLFVITGFDEAGAYDPVFANGRNMLKFEVTFAGTSGPIIRIFNQFFDYTYPTGGYDPSESRWFRLEVPSDQAVRFNWSATAPPGADIKRFRWVMDLVDLTDQTQRSNEETDVNHWSAWASRVTAATVGPFTTNNEQHLFYIEAEDNNTLVSLAVIYFVVVKSSFESDLLFVDDTRLRPDFRSGPISGPVDPPAGPWPTAAELDTFLFARGGVPWKSYPIDPLTGSQYLSRPGIFNGYAFDTIGTRYFSADGTVPLSLLGRYKHVVWYTDEAAASYTSSPNDRSTPITALRLVNSPGRPVILSTYMNQGFRTVGGNVWLCGGGAAAASLIPWNKANTTPNDFDSLEPNPELRPGRMMYDFAHWQEGIQMAPAGNARRFGPPFTGGSAGIGDNRPCRHCPPNPTPPGHPEHPDYSLLPVTLDGRSTTTDPPPPQRNPDSFWYVNDFGAEYISRPTFIREDYDPSEGISEFSTLDTLYLVRGGAVRNNSPIMTYYHGLENQPMVFSGFNFWFWRRTQCIELVDWVLQSVWGLHRDPVSRTPSVPAAARQASR